MKRKRPIPIGVEFYKQMIEDGYYYIDKTLLIRDILEQKSMVTLFTRPRRFGKTLTQSMLKTFFEKEVLPDGTTAGNSVYFQGKKLWQQEKNIQNTWDNILLYFYHLNQQNSQHMKWRIKS